MAGKKTSQRKFYAVSAGRKIGIFTSWNSASQSVTGFAKSSVKSYETLEEAKSAMKMAGYNHPQVFGDDEVSASFINWTVKGDVIEEDGLDTVGDNMTVEEGEAEKEELCVLSVVDSEAEKEELYVPDRERSEKKDSVCELANSFYVPDRERSDNKDSVCELATSDCICKTHKKERILKCSDCGHKIHWGCTELPLYQLCIYINTQRKFTCKLCANKFIDDKTSEDYQAILYSMDSAMPRDSSVDSSKSHQQTNKDTDTSLYQLLIAQQQESTTLLQNIEVAMTTLAEQTRVAEETRGDVLALLMNSSTHERVTLRDMGVMTTEHPQRKQPRKRGKKPSPVLPSLPVNTIPSPPSSTSSRPLPCRPPRSVSTADLMFQFKASAAEEETADTDSSSDTDDDNNASKNREDEKQDYSTSNTDVNLSLPHILIIHDDILDGIDSDRLGKSYDLRVTKQKLNSITECVEPEGEIPDAVLIHVGINDLKIRSPETVSQTMIQHVHALLKKNNAIKIIISKIAPTNDDKLYARGEAFNAVLYAELFNEKQVSFISHTNLQRQGRKGHLKDELHPSAKGSGIMAGNIGRHVRNLFWERPKRRPQHTRRPQNSREGQNNAPFPPDARRHTKWNGYRNNQRDPKETREQPWVRNYSNNNRDHHHYNNSRDDYPRGPGNDRRGYRHRVYQKNGYRNNQFREGDHKRHTADSYSDKYNYDNDRYDRYDRDRSDSTWHYDHRRSNQGRENSVHYRQYRRYDNWTDDRHRD